MNAGYRAMAAPALDHLVIAVDDLAQGVRWCEGVLGVSPGPGGRHPTMGTHNRLLRLVVPGGPPAYLELIAIDPQAPAPAHPRWFGLDRRPPGRPPQLVHWVLRCDDLAARHAAWVQAQADPGPPQAASRDTPQGRLSWELTVPADGEPGCRGALPALIAWSGDSPALSMPASGLALAGLQVSGLPAAAAPLVQVHGVTVVGTGPALQAVLLTPRGRVVIAGAD
jgi:hypothetical protein